MSNNDEYYLNIAREVAKRSKCLSRHVGAVLVQNDRIVATGFNGPPMRMRPCDERWIEDGLYNNRPLALALGQSLQGRCPRRAVGHPSGEGLHLCPAVHAERNALLSAALNGVSTKGGALYCWCGRPCKDCMVEIVNAGIQTLVFLKKDTAYDDLSGEIMKEFGLVVREVEVP